MGASPRASRGCCIPSLENGEADVGVDFLTDDQLTSPDLTVLEDEKYIWPFYYPIPVVRSEVLDENPEIENILNALTETLDLDTMRELNGWVGIEQEDPENVTEGFLMDQGLI
jgi:osmoprotectant transport system substrate-binding protein